MQRYNPETQCPECGADVHMIQRKRGEYVEYAEVKDELSRLKAQNETLKANIVMHWKEHERRRKER